MMFHRIVEHVKDQNWAAIVIDFVIVVVGVFIGIQLGNWNQAASDRRAETTYLVQLQGDLRNIQDEIATQIEVEQFHASLAADVYDWIRDDAAGDRALRINMGLSELAVRRTLRTQSPTFLDLQSSGKLELISDPALRAAIISYFFRISRLEAALDKNNATFIDRAYCDFLFSLHVPPRDWDSTLMNGPLGPGSALSSVFKESVGKRSLYTGFDAELGAPADDDFWTDIVPRLAWRGDISRNNESIAQLMSAATDELEATLARRIGRRAP